MLRTGSAILALLVSLSPTAHRAGAQDTQPAPTLQQQPATATNPAQAAIEQNVTLLTGNNTQEARRIGARGLLNADREALSRLAEVLRLPDNPMAQVAVCQELASIESPPVELVQPVLGLISHSRDDVATAAGAALARYTPEQVITPLKAMALGRWPGGNGRRAAIEALAGMGSEPDAVKALVEVLNEAPADQQRTVLEALSRATGVSFATPEDARTWWEQNSTKDRTIWLAERDLRRRAEIQRLEERITNLTSRLVEICRNEYLQSAETQQPARLATYLTDAEPAVRRLGLDLTNALITDRKPVPDAVAERVRGMLSDPVIELRRDAASMLGDIRNPRDAELLSAALDRESSGRVRTAMIRALGRIGDASLLPMLEKRLEDSSPEAMIEAITAVGLVCERAGTPPEALRRAADKVNERFAALSNPDAATLQASLETMRRLGDPRFGPVFLKYMQTGQPAEVRQAAIRGAATSANGELAEAIVALLSDETPSIRLAAATALGRCGRTDAHLEALLARAQAGIESKENVRAAAWESFRRIWEARGAPDRLRWALAVNLPADNTSPSKRVELLVLLERQLADDQANAALRPRVREALGDSFMQAGSAGDAAAWYQQAMASTAAPEPELLGKTAAAAARAENVDLLMQTLSRSLEAAASTNASQPAATPPIAAAVEEFVRLAAQRRIDAASAFVQQAEQQWADRLPPDWSEQLNVLRRALQTARNQIEDEAIRGLIAELALDDARAEAAGAALAQRGRAAAPALLAALQTTLAAQAASTNGSVAANGGSAESRLVVVLCAIVPDWSGYPADAEPTTKQAALDDLKRILEPPPPPPASAPAATQASASE